MHFLSFPIQHTPVLTRHCPSGPCRPAPICTIRRKQPTLAGKASSSAGQSTSRIGRSSNKRSKIARKPSRLRLHNSNKTAGATLSKLLRKPNQSDNKAALSFLRYSPWTWSQRMQWPVQMFVISTKTIKTWKKRSCSTESISRLYIFRFLTFNIP